MGRSVTEKILASHTRGGQALDPGEIAIDVDQAYVEDHTGAQVFFHLAATGLRRVRCPLAVCYANHVSCHSPESSRDHEFLRAASEALGVWFVKPGVGICHQVHLERFAEPGATIVGANSHTTHCGALGTLAFGVGGMDAAAVMAGAPLFRAAPRVMGVELVGRLADWVTAKDVALELLRRLTVRGGRGRVLEFHGPGVASLTVQERAILTNMCAELGALTGVFPSDAQALSFLRSVGRAACWRAIEADPDAVYDESLQVDLSSIEPLVALPSQPDRVVRASDAEVTVSQVMVGSCTEGSFGELAVVAAFLRKADVSPRVRFFVQPSSQRALEVAEEAGDLRELLRAAVELPAPSCDPCVGIGHVPAPGTRCLRTVSRNFPGRTGLAADAVYLSSTPTAVATAIRGRICDPRALAGELRIVAPRPSLPASASLSERGLVAPPADDLARSIPQHPGMSGTPRGRPLATAIGGEVLLVAGDDVTTDDICPSGVKTARHRSDISQIAESMFANLAPGLAERASRARGGWIVAGENYGMGSAREHATLGLASLGVHGVVARSFAAAHVSNMVNAGLLPLLFEDARDVEDIRCGDVLRLEGARRLLEDGTGTVENGRSRRRYAIHLELSARQRAILGMGGLLSWLTS